MRQPKSNQRRGAAALETAVIYLVFLTMLLGFLDLSLAVFRSHVCAQAARQGARMAIVRGALAPPELAEWGPATYNSVANSGDAIAAAIQPFLDDVVDLGATTITIEWLDGNTDLESRVRVNISTLYSPFLTFVFGNPTWTLSGVSTMPIAH